jgi:L-alanine-DL-glutamate epimerase-like enolase superfamily enzyme
VRITKVETLALRDEGKASETFIVITTDEGLTGLGQAESPSLIIDAIVRCGGGLSDLLVGEDPRDVARLWQKMYAATGLFGRRGVTLAAIGAAESALWDIAGKAAGRPVFELLGRTFCMPTLQAVEVGVSRQSIAGDGRWRTHVVPYATVYPPGANKDMLQEHFGLAVERGFRAVKLEEWPAGFGHGNLRADVETVKIVRDVIGPDRDLMLDVQNRWVDVGEALRTIRAIEEFQPYFVEGPLPPDNLLAYARLANAVDTRIAAGDWGFAGRFDLEALLEVGQVDVVQPSTVRSGGMLEMLSLSESAYRRGALCIPHSWCHMVGVACSVHVAAVVPNMPYIEFPIAFPDSPLISELLVPALKPNADGTITVPTRPGLGFELNPEVVAHFKVEPS